MLRCRRQGCLQGAPGEKVRRLPGRAEDRRDGAPPAVCELIFGERRAALTSAAIVNHDAGRVPDETY